MKTYFENGELNYLPIAEVTLQSPSSGKTLNIKLVIDTGFQGGVLIPLRTYLDLGLHLHEEPKVIAKTAVGGEVELRVSRVIIKVNNKGILCRAYTTLGVKKALLGREILEKLGLLYKPPNTLKLEP